MLNKNIVISLIVATICVSGIAADTTNSVLIYDDYKFFYELRNVPIAMVTFYAPWCGYSQQLLPELDLAANSFAPFSTPVKLIKVDCYIPGKPEQLATCANENIKGYPTIKIYKNGVFFENYNGARKQMEILNELFKLYNNYYGVQ